MIMVNGIKSIIRCCRDIRVISALDPERALLPLDIPLLATEEGALRWGGHDTLKVTAGLHRAVWVSGAVAYVDVNIVNNTRRRVNTIRLKLRRHILAYKNVGHFFFHLVVGNCFFSFLFFFLVNFFFEMKALLNGIFVRRPWLWRKISRLGI